jgi:hypothetical protein
MEKIIDQGIDICLEEFQKDANKKRVQENLLDPVIKYIGEQLWPYIMYSIIFISLLLLLLFYIIYIVHTKQLKI